MQTRMALITIVMGLWMKIQAPGDGDGDGYDEAQGDCADDNASIYPGAPEVWYNGVDENCDGLSDFDQDGDGSDSANFGGTDCNDLDSSLDGLDVDDDGVTTCFWRLR